MQKLHEFAITFVIIFFAAFTLLGVFGLLPADLQSSINNHPLQVFSFQSAATTTEAALATSASTEVEPTDAQIAAAVAVTPAAVINAPAVQYSPSGTTELPVRIIIPSININDSILNPTTTNEDIFESDLQKGAVRYPGSGTMNGDQNIYLFGHSSYLKVIHNQAYKTFDGIQNLKAGDEIELVGPETTSIYRVSTVTLLTDAQATVNIAAHDHELIISTCNVLAAKEDRILVVSQFVSNYKN